MEIQVIELKMMFGYSISIKVLSNGKNMNFKTKFALHPESTIVLQSVSKVQLKEWWSFMEEEEKQKKTKKVLKEIQMDAH